MAGIKDTKDGHILENTGDLFSDIAAQYPSRNYTKFCNKLGVKRAKSQAILKQRQLDYAEALTDVLDIWEEKQKGIATRAELESALEEADTSALCTIVAKYFSKDEEESEESEESEANEESSEGKGPGTKRKKMDSSPGPSTRNKKKKKALDNTKVTDHVIEELAKDICIDTKLGKLGGKLGFGFPAMKMYNAMNHAGGDVTYVGTRNMLIDWREKAWPAKSSILKKALIDAGLPSYAEKYF